MAIFRVRDKDGNIVEIPALVVVTSKNECYCSLPKYAHVMVGNEFKVYFRNIISLASARLWVGSHSNLATRYYADYLSITPTVEGNHSLHWKLYDEGGNVIERGTIVIIASSKEASGTTTALVIGDSTINAGAITQKAMELYADDGAILSLIGTRGTAPNLHEGRGGWTAYGYTHTADDGTYTNPFLYDGAFDFAKYMESQGFAGLQFVVIQLGINDVFSWKDSVYKGEQVLGYLDAMVSSILAYDGTINVVINLPTTPNSDGETFTETYGTTQLYWVYNRNIIRFARELMDHYGNHNSVTISGANCVLDTGSHIRDGVHPTEEGYGILGDRLYQVLTGIADGVVNLLTISGREHIINTTTTITPTTARELDFTKCYGTGFSGTRSFASSYDTYEPLGHDSLAFTSDNPPAATGVEFPVQLEVGKSYTLTYNASVYNARVYLLRYNADTTFADYTLLSTNAGLQSHTITPEAGYIYSVHFAPVVADRCVWSNISLTEQQQ